MTYKLTTTDYIIRIEDGLTIPADPENRDYAEYLQWLDQGNEPEPADLPPEPDALELAKRNREMQVAAIKVTTTAGNEFDGDEVSQGRMARAIIAMGETDTTAWVLADNSVVVVTRDELREALRLAGEAQTQVWVSIYQN